MALRLITFDLASSGLRKIGAFIDKKEVVDLSASLGIKDMRTFLETGEKGIKQATDVIKSGKNRIPFKEAVIRAPIYNPEKIICAGLNYLDHAKETGMAVPPEPVLFNKFPSSIIGTDENIVKPKSTNELDFEVELVMVIGKQGRWIKEDEALSYVAGYTVGHDVSARDWQLKKPGGQWMMGKTFDTFCPIGPHIVTKVSNPNNLGIRCILNEKIVQNSNTKEFIFKAEKLISYISNVVTLKPGDLIFTGTPPGVGMGRKPPMWMQPGDKVVCEIDEIGSISNNVIE